MEGLNSATGFGHLDNGHIYWLIVLPFLEIFSQSPIPIDGNSFVLHLVWIKLTAVLWVRNRCVFSLQTFSWPQSKCQYFVLRIEWILCGLESGWNWTIQINRCGVGFTNGHILVYVYVFQVFVAIMHFVIRGVALRFISYFNCVLAPGIHIRQILSCILYWNLCGGSIYDQCRCFWHFLLLPQEVATGFGGRHCFVFGVFCVFLWYWCGISVCRCF